MDLDDPVVATDDLYDAEDQRARLQGQTITSDTLLLRIEGMLYTVARALQSVADALSAQAPQDDNAPRSTRPEEQSLPVTLPSPSTNAPNPAQQPELAKARQENAALSAKLESVKRELQDAKADLASARQKEAKLHDMILAKASTQKVTDVEVKDKLASVRQSARAISHAFDVERVPRRVPGPMVHEMTAFYDAKNWGKLIPKDRRDRVMSRIFQMLDAQILSSALFSSRELSYQMPRGGDVPGTLPPLLSRVETVLEYNKVNDDLVADWRVATIACVSHLGTEAPMGKKVALDIYDFFVPILADIGMQGEDELLDRITKMCQEAYDLRMMMRKSKTKYECVSLQETPRPWHLDEQEALVEPISVEGAKNKDASDEIAYVLFGGLIKRTETGNKLLEKAQVIMKPKNWK